MSKGYVYQLFFAVQWYSADKIKRIARKLRGINPVKILQEEIEANLLISKGYRDGCIRLLNRDGSRRSTLPLDNISIADQVIISIVVHVTRDCVRGEM